MIVVPCKQGTPGWFAARLGRPTASRGSDIITRKKREVSASRTHYANMLCAELLLGRPLESFTSGAMKIGTEREADAASAYGLIRNCDPIEVGFVTTDDGKVGASPDRLVPPGLLELKSPEVGAHVAYALSDSDSLVDAYWIQLQFQLWVCEAPWVDICSYYPGLPEAIVRVEREEAFIETMARHTYELVDIVALRMEKLAAMGYEPAVPQPEPVDTLGITDADVAWILNDRFPEGEQTANGQT